MMTVSAKTGSENSLGSKLLKLMDVCWVPLVSVMVLATLYAGQILMV